MYNFNFKGFLADFLKPFAVTVVYFLSTAAPSAWALPYSFDIHHLQERSGLRSYHRDDCENYSNNHQTWLCSSLASIIGEDEITAHLHFSTWASSDHPRVFKHKAFGSYTYENSAKPQLFPAGLTLVVPQTTEEDERALSLNTTKRREIQVRLTLLGFDTKGSDGIFGPRSREAIGKWQAANSFPETGFLNMQQYQTILSTSDAAYEEWKRKQPKLRRVKVCKRGAFGALVDCRLEYR